MFLIDNIFAKFPSLYATFLILDLSIRRLQLPVISDSDIFTCWFITL